jgi:phenylacetate-CoA ligase
MNVTTSFAVYFIDACQTRGVNTKSLGITGFMVGGEPGGGIPHIRNRIEEAFNANVQELMGNGDMIVCVWAECEKKRGMHFIAQGKCYPEIINPDTGDVLDIKDGVQGELVYTSLDRECQPLIRFRTRDHVVVTHTSCECGRTGYAVRCIGRTDDMLIVSGVNVYPSAVREVVGSFIPRVSGNILIQLEEPPPAVKPPMKIKVELGREGGDLSELKSAIESLLRAKLIFKPDVELVTAGSLPKYEYKSKLVEKIYEKK